MGIAGLMSKNELARKNGGSPEDFHQEVMTVTPELAALWLERNVSNRPIDQRVVDRYARDMALDKWHLTGDPIGFDTEHWLVQGQHRLWACVQSDQPFRTNVVVGIEAEAKIVLDTGKKRTLGQFLSMAGEKSGTNIAAAVNLCWRWENGLIKGDGSLRWKDYPTHEEALDWLTAHPEVRESAKLGAAVYREVKLGATPISAAHFLNAQSDWESADRFWAEVKDGVGIQAGSPVLALRRWISGMLAKRGRPSSELILVHSMLAMSLWRDGRSMSALHLRSGANVTTWDGVFPRGNEVVATHRSSGVDPFA